VVPETSWDETIGQPAELTKMAGCGENRFVGIKNFIEFYLDTGCTLVIEPRDAIKGMVRLEWTLSEFYADGGVTRFIDRLASSLGIHASRIKTVQVREGSVIIDFFIESETTSDEDADQAQSELDDITAALLSIIEDGTIDLGAPILGFVSNGELIYGDEIPVDAQAVGL